jgi:hypothetical protein
MLTVDELAAYLSSPKMAGAWTELNIRRDLALTTCTRFELLRRDAERARRLSRRANRTSVVIKGCPQFCQYLRHDQKHGNARPS